MIKPNAFKRGAETRFTIQPAIAESGAMAYGLAETTASYLGNVSVLEFALGCDFATSPAGVRLAEGAYLAVQIPDILGEWVYHPASG